VVFGYVHKLHYSTWIKFVGPYYGENILYTGHVCESFLFSIITPSALYVKQNEYKLVCIILLNSFKNNYVISFYFINFRVIVQ